MKKILALNLLIVFWLTACSTQKLKTLSPPSPNRLEVLRNALLSKNKSVKPSGMAEEITKNYLEALKAESEGNSKLACEIFDDLSDNLSFPLKEAALIHALSHCNFSNSKLIRIWKKTVMPNYLQEAYLKTSLLLAEKNKLPFYEAQFSNDLIAFIPVQSEKIKLIKKAIALSEKNQDSEKIIFYTNRLKILSPLYNSEINDKNIYSIAKDFESNRKFDVARLMYKKIIDGEFDLAEKVKAFNAFRMSYKIQRDLKTFLAKTFDMEAFLKTELDQNPKDLKAREFWVDSKITLARAVWTDHQTDKAQKILNELIASKLGNNNQSANTHFILGSLLLEGKKNLKALKQFEKANAFKMTDNSILENVQWAIVWNYYLLKKNNKVVSFADLFIKENNNQSFTVKLEYWKARALVRLKKNKEANEIFTKIYAADPFGYYGLIASIDLKAALTPLSAANIKQTPSGFLTLDWLLALGEINFSEKYLKEINSQFKTPTEREKAMSLYFQTGWFQGGMRQIYNFRMSSRAAITEKYIKTIFPTPFLNSVEKLSEKYSVPKELIFAITRQESAFVPSERSWADAFGLMQMIPEKGSELSKKYKIPYHDYNDLYKPEVNIEMGTALLKELRDQSGVKFIQTVSGYNASEAAMKIWEKERFNGNYLEFIEMIPYEETRNYIKLVFRNFIIYKRITAKKEFRLDKDFFAKPF